MLSASQRFVRAAVEADVDGTPVRCHPQTIDLLPNRPPERVRVFVPRPKLGDLILAFHNAATLYGATLTVAVSDGEQRVERQWREHEYEEAENSVRWAIRASARSAA